MSKAGQKEFARSLSKLASNILKINEMANQAIQDLTDLTVLSKGIFIVTQDDIIPLVAEEQDLVAPEPGAELVHALPKRTRTRRHKIDLSAEPPAESETKIEEPGEPPEQNEQAGTQEE